jgi:general secretion pathway protein K
MTRDRTIASSSERGFVIVAVLWILVALSSLAMIFSLYLSVSAHALAASDRSLQTEALVSAGVELAAYQLALAGDKERPARGSFGFRLDDANIRVDFASEAARIDLNYAPKEMLANLFAVLGAGRDAATNDADRIVGWRTRPVPGGANDEEALYGAAGYVPRQALFSHANELSLVLGLAPALVERALPFLTVFNGSAGVDRTIAAPEVVAALLDRASNRPGDAAGEPVGSISSGSTTTDGSAAPTRSAAVAKSPCYRVEIAINFRDGRHLASEVIIVLGDRVEPYRVLSWQDDLEALRAMPGRRS